MFEHSESLFQMKMRFVKLIFSLLLCVVFSAQLHAKESFKYRTSNDSEKTRVVFEFSKIVNYIHEHDKKRSIFTLRIRDDDSIRRQAANLADSLVSETINYITYRDSNKEGYFDIIFNLKGFANIKIFDLLPTPQNGYRIIVDIFKNVTYTIVLDPAHGGVDLGTIHGQSAFEKDLTLNVAKQLKEIISAKEGFSVVMTRQGDDFLYPHSRYKNALAGSADLFISIHADKVNERPSTNISVLYYLGGVISGQLGELLLKHESEAILLGNVADLLNNVKQPHYLSAESQIKRYPDTNRISRQVASTLTQELSLRFSNQTVASQGIGLDGLANGKIPSVLINLNNAFYIDNEDSNFKLQKQQDAIYRLAEAIVQSAKATQ